MAGQVTFWVVTLGGTALGTVTFYPGVLRHARSRRDSVIAAFMASLLGATALALFLSTLVNVVSQAS